MSENEDGGKHFSLCRSVLSCVRLGDSWVSGTSRAWAAKCADRELRGQLSAYCKLRGMSRALGVIRRYCNQLWIFCGDYAFRVFDRHPRGKRDIIEDQSKVELLPPMCTINFYLWYFIMPQIMFFPFSVNITARLACTNNDSCSTDSLARLKIGFKSTK